MHINPNINIADAFQMHIPINGILQISLKQWTISKTYFSFRHILPDAPLTPEEAIQHRAPRVCRKAASMPQWRSIRAGLVSSQTRKAVVELARIYMWYPGQTNTHIERRMNAPIASACVDKLAKGKRIRRTRKLSWNCIRESKIV